MAAVPVQNDVSVVLQESLTADDQLIALLKANMNLARQNFTSASPEFTNDAEQSLNAILEAENHKLVMMQMPLVDERYTQGSAALQASTMNSRAVLKSTGIFGRSTSSVGVATKQTQTAKNVDTSSDASHESHSSQDHAVGLVG